MSHYVLVHGAWEEARAWDDVAQFLTQHGHQVSAIDLPGHGNNKQQIEQVTMSAYIQNVVDNINQLDHAVILVGHSMSGAVISQVGEQIPEKIERLIYVAAFLLNAGDTVMGAMESDHGNELLPEIIFSEDQRSATVSEQTLRRVGFHDVSEAVIQRILPLMGTHQATQPFMAKIEVSDENFGRIPKSYIRTTIDKITTAELQDRMITNWQVENVLSLEAGHFPAFSAPEKLAGLLLESIIVEKVVGKIEEQPEAAVNA